MWEIVCAPTDLQVVRAELESSGIQIESGDITYLPSTSIALDASSAPKVIRLVDALEDLDDVQAVFANFDIPEDILANLE
jgi:transcriptional/translational regulatory protein YebC/TACO1